MWIDEKDSTRGHDLYPETMDAIKNALANLSGDWTADITIATDGTGTFELMAADHEKDREDIVWENGLAVVCVMRYGRAKAEKEMICEVMVTFQTDEGEDHKKELELIVAILYAWVEEEAFANARMAVNVESLLGTEDIHDELKEVRAFIRSSNYRA